MKKVLLTIALTALVLTLITVVIFFVWTEDFKNKIPYFNQLSNNTSLVVQSKNSSANVKIDGKDYGETPLEIETLSKGTHTVTMTRVVEGDEKVFYEPATFFVELNNNTEAFINIEIGPNNQISGYVLSYSAAPYSLQEGNYLVKSNYSTRLTLDDKEIGKTPTEILKAKPGDYTLKSNAEGFDPLEVPIVLRAKYNLNIELYLLPVPVNISE
ncbi:MAG: hypothetical protein Fur003_1020 [Candidatus Dojkabacteria bacterium]